MKKTKLLTSLIALVLVASLGACETGDININVGDVTLGDNDSSSSDTSSTESSETTPSEPSEDSSSSSSTPEEPPVVTYTYSLEVENGDSLTLTYDEALETQQGVELSIKLVTTSSTGGVTKEDASADNLTFTVSDPTVVTVSGLTVLPLKEGSTSITIKWSEHDEATASVGVTVTDVTVYGPTSWADYITNEYDLGVIAGAFGDVSLDDILPFSYELLTNSSYSFQSYYVSAESFRLMYSWPSDSTGLYNAWDALLTEFGYTLVSTEGSGPVTYTYTLEGGYTVKIITSTWGDWDLYLYPPEPEPADPASWADYITNEYDLGVLAQTFGDVALDDILPFYLPDSADGFQSYYVSAEYFRLYYYTFSPSGITSAWDAALLEFGYTLESSGTNNFGGTTYVYTYNGYEVDIVTTPFGDWDLYLYPPEPEPAAPTTWAEFINNDYDLGVLYNTLGTDIDNVLPFYYEETGYSGYYAVSGVRFYLAYYYPSNTLTDGWIAALTEFGYTLESSASNNFGGTTYTLTYNGYEVEIITSSFGEWTLNLYPPVEEADEDLETAQAILNAVQGNTPNWTAFYGNAEDTYGGELTSYLALDANDALYGYKESDDWDDETYTYYFYNGYRCMYNTNNVAQEPKEITTTFEEELELYIAGLSVSFNLATDSYELGEVNDGYSLAVTHNYIEYTFIVDASYNLLSLEREQIVGSSSDYVDWSYVEGIDFEDVEYALSETGFDPDDFFGEQGGDEEAGEEPSGLTLADYIAALSDKGFNYGDGFYFSQQSLDMSSGLDYDSLEIEALSNDVGYASQGHYDTGTGYYASEFYSDGTTTYMYDSDDQEAADAGGLYGYWLYQYTLESYFEFDTITGQLNSLGEDADLTDSDNVITDSYLYLYAYASDYSAMVELYATYDENGITYLVYSYGTNTSSYAVVFYPTESVTTPDWYVPATGSSSLADLFNAALEEKNYTIVLEITDYQSDPVYAEGAFAPNTELSLYQDLWCKITYTTDAAVVEYYANYEEFLAGTVMDVEYYLNTDNGLDIFMIFDWYDVDTVYYQWAEEGLTWQDYLGSLFGLEDYFSNFVEGETTTTDRGTEISYTLDNLDEDFLGALVSALIDNGNYWAWETGGIDEITDISCSYLVDSETIEFVFVSDEYTYHDEENYCYYLEQTTIKVYVLDAGSSSTPEYTLEYNW